MKITFVCTGNTCRSPMLARMFEDYAAKVGFECVTDSAGMKGGGSPVNPKAARTLALRGLEASGHVSKVFGEGEADSDFVFTMTEEQRDKLRAEYPSLRVECLSLFTGEDVADPYGGDQSAYDSAADLFEGILGAIHDYVTKTPGSK